MDTCDRATTSPPPAAASCESWGCGPAGIGSVALQSPMRSVTELALKMVSWRYLWCPFSSQELWIPRYRSH